MQEELNKIDLKEFKKVDFFINSPEKRKNSSLDTDNIENFLTVKSIRESVVWGKDKHNFGNANNKSNASFSKKNDDYEDSVSHMTKSKSEKKQKIPFQQELYEDAVNISKNEFYRRQEVENWSEPKKILYQNLDRLIDFHVNEIIEKLFEEKELQEVFQNDGRENAEIIWKERFLEYTLKAIRLVKPSKRTMNDSMDINDYVEIKLIEYKNDSKCKYINGCVIQNNIADKRMRSNIENPQILLVGNSVGFWQENNVLDGSQKTPQKSN